MKQFSFSSTSHVLIFAYMLVFWMVTSAFSTSIPTETKAFISIEKLMDEGKLSVSINGLGGYQQECVIFTIQNLTSDTVLLRIEPGRILQSKDSSMQDILIVKHKNITLPPFAELKEKGYGFCCKSHHHSPNKEAIFNVGTMAPEGWQKLAIVIDQGNYPVKAIQDAVWCLSNNHSISAITDQHPEKVELLRRTVAKIKGIEVPWYTIFYEAANEEHQLFSDKHERLTGDVNYFVNSNSIISMVIKNQNGQVMKQLVKGNSKNSGSFIYSLDLSVVDWPKGEYTIYIYEDYSNLNKKVVFKL